MATDEAMELVRQHGRWLAGEADKPDLSGAYLSGADLSGATGLLDASEGLKANCDAELKPEEA